MSSTFDDLKSERQAAVEAILSAGHIPAGMELFTAGDESQMEVIKQWIDESDVHMLILGGRYGSVEPQSGKSYTQLEYEYALSLSKPLFACVVEEEALERRVKAHGSKVIETDNPQKLKAFRAEVLSKMVRFWEETKDIKIAVGETLAQFSRRVDLVGWVRPTATANIPALTDEIARLSKQNADLREELRVRSRSNSMALSFSELEQALKAKGLLEYLETIYLAHARRRGGYEPTPELAEIAAMGLMEASARSIDGIVMWYELSEIGMAFLQKLAVQKACQLEPDSTSVG